MPDLVYSDDAVNVLGRFHQTDTMLFVEGDEDIPFWEAMFDIFTDLSVKVESVGGKPALLKYAESIIGGKLDIIVAFDRDYSYFDEQIVHTNVLYTYGYSIENSIVTVETVQKSIQSLGRISRKMIDKDEISSWLGDLEISIKPILMHDICNYVNKHGCKVANNNCSRFMSSKSSDKICDRKVSDFINSLTFSITSREQSKYARVVKIYGLSVLDAIRGHFLFTAVHRFIALYLKKLDIKASISNESLFSSMMLSLENTFSHKHPHYEYYKTSLENVVIV